LNVITSIFFRFSLLVTLLALSCLTVAAQQKTYRIYGKVVNGSNSALKNVSVWVEDEGSRREIGRGSTNDKGEYSILFSKTGIIKIYYGAFDNVIVSLAGNTNHQVTKVVTNIAPVRSGPDQGTPLR
jgi:hypothetical protein